MPTGIYQRKLKNPIDRFLPKVKKTDTCWIWIGASHSTGYGRFGSHVVTFAHRASWEIFKGKIPDGLYVCHHCDVRLCVNPDHLFLGTAKDNMQDASKKGRIKIPENSYRSDETHQVAKLSRYEVIEIRASTEGSNALAKKYKVCPHTIWNVRTRRTFRDIE